ncbi:sugar fermentation stimulation protein [Thermocrinis albus DSM 14484]|uniref:Sugar fermentation stimulation protein homolog n=1 Tax=Thermocrinis albus (strain DSM 14484 / JCM 11386 / HI 11/12) TaxID=638303 RepID=D3SP59_THEAH|nr:DNA/RNA nuclease SfsA [Thermocrinis albus]ADC88946.1 sugar fermentation stimulation protein [Thermocrinis albus DSM 14484]
MLLGTLREAIFLERINRFICRVLYRDGQHTAYLRNTGRLRELLKEGTKVYVREKEGGKHPLELLLVDAGSSLVCVDSTIPPFLYEEYTGVKGKREPRFGNVRFDLLVDKKIIETKSVNLVRDKVALFPDAPTLRGRKHVEELIKLGEEGYEPLIVFVVQREDALYFSPNWDTDPDFCRALVRYREKGFQLQAYACKVSMKEIMIEKPLDIIF